LQAHILHIEKRGAKRSYIHHIHIRERRFANRIIMQ
jgi:hypothetical protein